MLEELFRLILHVTPEAACYFLVVRSANQTLSYGDVVGHVFVQWFLSLSIVNWILRTHGISTFPDWPLGKRQTSEVCEDIINETLARHMVGSVPGSPCMLVSTSSKTHNQTRITLKQIVATTWYPGGKIDWLPWEQQDF